MQGFASAFFIVLFIVGGLEIKLNYFYYIVSLYETFAYISVMKEGNEARFKTLKSSIL